jgi:hypothetical protein
LHQKCEANPYATNYEDNEYFLLLIIFYSISKFKFDESKNKEWLSYIFKMHNAQSKDYFDFVLKNFSNEDLKE